MSSKFPSVISTAAILLVLLLFSKTHLAQSASQTPPPEGDTVKINTDLIQLDATVRQRDGQAVKDLKKENFQVYQDGRSQKILSVNYVDPQLPISFKRPKNEKNNIGTPPSGVRSGEVRLITFVLDDGNCLASVEGSFNMREAMRKFVDEQMRPEDRVAIYQTRSGTSLLQTYTSNREVLRKRISKLGLLAPGGCLGWTQPSTPGPIRASMPPADRYRREQDSQLTGTIGVLNFVVDRLKDSGQRNEIFLFSEGLVPDRLSASSAALRELADKAARASVVVNTVSNRGLGVSEMITAADGIAPGDTTRFSNQSIDEDRALSGGLAYLAYSTGGQFIGNNNFPEKTIGRLLNADRGYYLIAYEPNDSTFLGKDFHKIDVKVDDPNLAVTSRKGFFGRVDEVSRSSSKTADGDLFRAVASPFAENGIDLRLTLIYGNSSKSGHFLRSMFHLRGDELSLVDDGSGRRKFAMDVVAVVLDEKAKVLDEFNRTYSIVIPANAVASVLKDGLDFAADMPIDRTGVYSYRIAVRDKNSKRLGSAGDFIEVRDIKEGRFFVAGLILTSLDQGGNPIMPGERPANASFAPVTTKASPAIRQYRDGDTLVYSFNAYNTKVKSNSVSLTRQIRLFRNGQLLLDSGEKPIDPISSGDFSRISNHGTVKITSQVEKGEYSLQVVVRDKYADTISEQSVDFEVIE